jgi:oxygen-independent coproporphyrinogen-3 oxidase
LYIHVPFCAHRCGYCDFVTTSRSPELHDRYVQALARELELQWSDIATPDSPRFDTIFVGGGTPTLLEHDAMAGLLDLVTAHAADDAEVTIECNPETVDEHLAAQLVAGGITRVSLGAQSFDRAVLETLERRAQPDTIRAAVKTLRDAGISRLSLDLIWGVPGQTPDSVKADLAAALALEPDHLSAYELEFKPGTRLAHAYGVDRDAAVGEASDELYDLVVDELEDAGWWWYETANFAREAQERCRHNLAYWHAEQWVAIGVGGVGAQYTADGGIVRRTNLPNLPRYLASIEQEASELPPARIEHVDARTARIEQLMLALRLDATVRVTAADLADQIVSPEAVERMVDHRLLDASLTIAPDNPSQIEIDLRLTRRGRMLQAAVAGDLLDA